MSEPVHQGPGEPFTPHNLHSGFERQVGGNDQTGAFIGSIDRLKEQFGSSFRERDVAQLIQDDEVHPLQLLVGAHQFCRSSCRSVAA